MPTYLERYIAGEYEAVWDELLALGADVRQELYYGDAVAVTRETMRRVRHNCEMLIPRLESLGWKFGYDWADARYAGRVANEPPILGDPTSGEFLDWIEAFYGILPISLRAFYEVVGAINFVGTPFSRPKWPGLEDGIDPLYVTSADLNFKPEGHFFSEYYDMGWVGISPDFCHKYYTSGVGWEGVMIADLNVDTPLMFEGEPLEVEDRVLTFVRYLRYALQGGGFLNFLPGYEPDAMPVGDLAFLTKDLLPI